MCLPALLGTVGEGNKLLLWEVCINTTQKVSFLHTIQANSALLRKLIAKQATVTSRK